MKKDFYEILAIPRFTSDRAEIRSAFLKLAHRYHPDKNPLERDAIKFMAGCEAYHTLSDPALRATYDLSLVKESQEEDKARVGGSDESRYVIPYIREFEDFDFLFEEFVRSQGCGEYVDYSGNAYNRGKALQRYHRKSVGRDVCETGGFTVHETRQGFIPAVIAIVLLLVFYF